MVKNQLHGIDEICSFAKRSPAELMGWKRDFDFPMQKVDGIWVSTEDDIIRFYTDRGVNPKTVSHDKLRDYELRKNWKAGHGWLNRTLRGYGEIQHLFGLTLTFIMDLAKNYDGCPIQKTKPDGVVADADELYFWLTDHDIPFTVNLSKPLPL